MGDDIVCWRGGGVVVALCIPVVGQSLCLEGLGLAWMESATSMCVCMIP